MFVGLVLLFVLFILWCLVRQVTRSEKRIEKRLGGFDRIQSRLVQIVAILIKSREFELQECKDTVSEEIKLMEPPFKVSDEKVDFRGLAHEIWATAQLLPGEGIEDGVDRIEEILNENFDLGRGVPIDSVDNEGPA